VVLVLEFQRILHFLAGHLADNRPDQTADFPGDFPGDFPSDFQGSKRDRDSELFIGLPKWVGFKRTGTLGRFIEAQAC
jgi:hypothetical protein